MHKLSEFQTGVIIIGAGVAGLAAAAELFAAGEDYIILEARDRIGGRVLTVKDESSIVVELGAEFIHGRSSEVWDVVNKHSLPTFDVTERHWQLERGKLIDTKEYFEELETIMAGMASITGEEDISFSRYLQEYHSKTREDVKETARGYIEGFNAADSSLISVEALNLQDRVEEEEDGTAAFRLQGGFHSLVEQLARDALRQDDGRERILYGAVVSEVAYSSTEGVRIAYRETNQERQKSISGRFAICTLPLAILKNSPNDHAFVKFSPELPISTSEALDAVQMGHVVKIVMQFRERFWENCQFAMQSNEEPKKGWELGFIHCREVPIPTWWTMLPMRAPIIVGWLGGAEAHRLVNTSGWNAIDAGVASLSTITGVSAERIRANLVRGYHHDWSHDPYSLGSYSYIGVGGLARARNFLDPVEQVLYFAGEHTEVDGKFGTVHGAMASGRRAARRILNCEKRPSIS
jgi:monoamine oxidase